jgi:hypothetical protein
LAVERDDRSYLVLMVWGDKYSDQDCNRLIDSTRALSRKCAGVVVLTDRTDRQLPHAAQVPIAADFNLEHFKKGGLPVKISIFDIPEIPRGATCIFLDLDTVVLGNLDRLAELANRGPLWTMSGTRSFSPFWRLVSRLTGGRHYAFGNASAFVYRNGFPGNPTDQFRKLRDLGRLAEVPMRDERFVAWSCQNVIRGISSQDVVSFRLEFLTPAMWITHLYSILRRRRRQRILAITFTGINTKPEVLARSKDRALITDHHGRVGRWSQFHTSGLKDSIAAAMGVDARP